MVYSLLGSLDSATAAEARGWPIRPPVPDVMMFADVGKDRVGGGARDRGRSNREAIWSAVVSMPKPGKLARRW